ncbi:hypothetical protein Lal_00022623 [Lupinus albus]|uniref:Putative transcription factor MADS-type1 family n=1 Tax=Lupinus albus TaxID=3870 RepID=A0A6A4PCH4_LUPAL|nr:putative transcription factor MADS-type1 family [Lupinus albus]KAF1895126.1 hypothetical protein Lal_00022623 [Lupinus albus]
MARKKVKIAYIANDAKRKATYKTRKNGLIKKTKEISTLCGVEACAIIYYPNEPLPEVWPSHFDVQRVLYKFMTTPPLEQSKKMFNQESFLMQRLTKAREQLKKKKSENWKEEMSLLMFKCLSYSGSVAENVNVKNANDLLWVIDQNLKDVDQKIKRDQSHEETLVASNSAFGLNGEMDPIDRNVQEMMQTNANSGANEMVPFGCFNISNGFSHGPFVH